MFFSADSTNFSASTQHTHRIARRWESMESYAGLIFLVVLILTKGAEVFVGRFDVKTFIFQYIGIPVYLLCIFGYKLMKKSHRVRLGEADMITDVPEEIVAEERAPIEKARHPADGARCSALYWNQIYHMWLSWLFWLSFS